VNLHRVLASGFERLVLADEDRIEEGGGVATADVSSGRASRLAGHVAQLGVDQSRSDWPAAADLISLHLVHDSTPHHPSHRI